MVNFYSLSFLSDRELPGSGSEMIFSGSSSGSPKVLDPIGSGSTTLSSRTSAIAEDISDAFSSMDASSSVDASISKDASNSQGC
jgi:hypothetical protein